MTCWRHYSQIEVSIGKLRPVSNREKGLNAKQVVIKWREILSVRISCSAAPVSIASKKRFINKFAPTPAWTAILNCDYLTRHRSKRASRLPSGLALPFNTFFKGKGQQQFEIRRWPFLSIFIEREKKRVEIKRLFIWALVGREHLSISFL